MIKGFLLLIVGLVSVDMAFRHGVGTFATIHFFESAAHSFTASLQDSIFSH